MPAESSGTSAALHEEERSMEDPLLNEDYLDPQSMAAPAPAVMEGSVFEEEHLTLQAEEQGNMHVCMMQGLPNYMEDNWAVLLPHTDNKAEGGSPPGRAGKGDVTDNVTSGVSKEDVALYGVFDGHNGYRCSLYAREMLLKHIKAALPEDEAALSHLEAAIRAAYLKTDSDFAALGVRDGSCETFFFFSSCFLFYVSILLMTSFCEASFCVLSHPFP